MKQKKKTKKDTTQLVFVRIPSEMKTRIEKIKKKTGISMNAIVLNCIDRQITMEENEWPNKQQ